MDHKTDSLTLASTALCRSLPACTQRERERERERKREKEGGIDHERL